MNTFKQILVFLTLVTFVAAQDLSELRQWTSTSGSQLEAKLVSLDVTKGTVKLMTADGKEFNIAIGLLVEADRDLLKKWHEANPPKVSEPAAPPAAPSAAPKPNKGRSKNKRVDLSKPRQWTSTAGSKMEASVVDLDLDQGMVKLKTINGREMNISLRLLVEADRGILKTWHNSQASKEKGSGTVTEAEANKLSVFRDGKWKGYNTVYEGPFYDAGLNSKGFLIIFPKDESGARVGKHLTAGLYCYYTQKGIGRHTRRDVISFETSPQPVVSSKPLELRLQGKFADDVAFDVEFECEDDKVSVEGGIKDPPGIKFPSRYNSRINVPAIYNPGPDDNPDDIKDKFAAYSVAVRTDEGTETHPYHIPLKSKNQVKDIRVKGPWDNKQLRIETPGIRNRETKETDYGTFWVYSHNPAYRGYYMMRSGTSGYRKGRVILHLREK